MKTRFALLVVAAAVLAACTASGYRPGPNEALYGTWIGVKAAHQKMVIEAGTLTRFALADDTQAFHACAQRIAARWADAEGNLWYKTSETITGGLGGLKGSKWQSLHRLSRSGMTLETVAIPVRDFDAKAFPHKLDPANEAYAVFHRGQEAAFPHAVLYGDAWK